MRLRKRCPIGRTRERCQLDGTGPGSASSRPFSIDTTACTTRCGYGISTPCALSTARMARLTSDLTLPWPFSRIADPEAHGELHAVGGEAAEHHVRRRIGQHPRDAVQRSDEQRLQRAHIGAVGDLHRGRDRHARIGERRVLDALRDQRLVGNDRLATAERADDRVAGADVGDAALEAVDLHHVADAQAPFGQDHEAADVVGGDLLQAEAEADADRAAEHRQRGQVDADRRQRQQQADEQQQRAHDVGGHLADRQVGARLAQQLAFDRGRDPQREHQHDAGGQGAFDDVAQA